GSSRRTAIAAHCRKNPTEILRPGRNADGLLLPVSRSETRRTKPRSLSGADQETKLKAACIFQSPPKAQCAGPLDLRADSVHLADHSGLERTALRRIRAIMSHRRLRLPTP